MSKLCDTFFLPTQYILYLLLVKANYATNRKVAGSIPEQVIIFLNYLILPAALGPKVYSALTEMGTRNIKKKCFW
jgi:hypothetical protein